MRKLFSLFQCGMICVCLGTLLCAGIVQAKSIDEPKAPESAVAKTLDHSKALNTPVSKPLTVAIADQSADPTAVDENTPEASGDAVSTLGNLFKIAKVDAEKQPWTWTIGLLVLSVFGFKTVGGAYNKLTSVIGQLNSQQKKELAGIGVFSGGVISIINSAATIWHWNRMPTNLLTIGILATLFGCALMFGGEEDKK